jgi:hypothetical protein
MRIKKFNEKFTNFTNGDYLPQEMAFADLMSDADTEDRFDMTRSFDRVDAFGESVIVYSFKIKIGEWVNDGMRQVTYTKPNNLYEDFKKRNDFLEEIYIACVRTEDEYPEVKIEMTESWNVSSTWMGNQIEIKIRMTIKDKKKVI